MTKSDEGEPIIIVNGDFFFGVPFGAAVHAKLLRETGASAQCDGGPRCGCVRGVFVEELMQTVFRNRPGELSRRQRMLMRDCLGQLAGNLPAAAAPIPPPAPRASTSIVPPDSPHNHGYDGPRTTPAQAEIQQGADTIVSECMRLVSGVFNQADKVERSGRKGREVSEAEVRAALGKCTSDQCAEVSIVLVSGHSVTDRQGRTVGIHCADMEACKQQLRTALSTQAGVGIAAEFAELLVSTLAISVFRLPLDVAKNLSIFWEDGRTIAFNKGGSLFFNLKYYMQQREAQGKARSVDHATLADYWFVVMAHELAHNIANGHGKEHESVMETLLQSFMRNHVVASANRL